MSAETSPQALGNFISDSSEDVATDNGFRAVRLNIEVTVNFTSKRLMPLLLAILLCGVAFSQNPQTSKYDWKVYAFEGDGIEFSAPSQPTFEKQPAPAADDPREQHIYAVGLGSSFAMFSVADLKRKQSDPDPPVKAFLETSVSSFLRERKCQLVSERQVFLDKYFGIEFEGTSAEYRFRARMFYVRGKLVSAVVAGPVRAPFLPESDRLLDSLHLISMGTNTGSHPSESSSK